MSRMASNRINASGLPYWITRPIYVVSCDDCGWRAEGENAKGLAARHAMAYHHYVHVDEARSITYCGNELKTT